jgi:hypothetical protein
MQATTWKRVTEMSKAAWAGRDTKARSRRISLCGGKKPAGWTGGLICFSGSRGAFILVILAVAVAVVVVAMAMVVVVVVVGPLRARSAVVRIRAASQFSGSCSSGILTPSDHVRRLPNKLGPLEML